MFVGDVNDRCRGLDDETGELLWEVSLGLPVSGFPSPTWSTAGRTSWGARPTAALAHPHLHLVRGGPTWSAWQAGKPEGQAP